MKHTWKASGGISGRWSGIKVLNEEMAPRKNLFLVFSAGMVWSGQRLQMTSKMRCYSRSSPSRSLQDLSSVLIPGEGVPELLPGICSPSGESWWETGLRWKRESHQRPRRILEIFETQTCFKRRNPTGETTTLSRWICIAIQLPKGKWYDEGNTNSQTGRTGRWWLDCHNTLISFNGGLIRKINTKRGLSSSPIGNGARK